MLLTSAGFSTPEIANTCIQMVGKPASEISFAIVNEAYAAEPGDHSWVLNELNQLRTYFSGPVEFINLLALSQKAIQSRLLVSDVILVLGGHTDYLMQVCNRSGVSELLKQGLEEKVYVGSSAGSMIMGKRISTQAYATIYGESSEYEVPEYLGIVNAALVPHFNNPEFPASNRQELEKIRSDYPGKIYAMSDNSAIMVDGFQEDAIGDVVVLRDLCEL